MIVISEEQAILQLRGLITPYFDLPVQWNPFNNIKDDYDVLEWVRNPGNEWCSGKKADFQLFLGKPIYYLPGNYAIAVLDVLGIRVTGKVMNK